MEIVIAVIIWGCVWGIATKIVIENKGYDDNWFWWGFLFGFIAFLVAMAKPERKENSGNKSLYSTKVDENAVSKNGWICKKCGRDNFNYADFCLCGYKRLDSIRKEQNCDDSKEKIVVENISNKQVVSAAEEIREFKKLLDDGIISQEEFDKKKQQLLDL